MTETKFTPGPWKVTDTGDVSIDIDAPYYEAMGVSANEESPFCVIISRRHVASRLEANAHLIAAAPELYEALELAANSSGFQYMFSETRDAINAALAKARGE